MFPFLKKKATLPKIPVNKIDPDAIGILKRLNRDGFDAYLVGGGVRDLLIGIRPKDFDIATNARPRQASRLLGRNAFVIGKRFKIVLVAFPEKGKQIEIATFRRAPEYSDDSNNKANTPLQAASGALYQTDDNEWGTIEEDVRRRDFTANALYYDYSQDQIVDFVGGIGDIAKKTLRCIGDPNIRFREDPVRMIRAVRLAAKLGFTIDKASVKAIGAHAAEIGLASKPRLFDEVLKIFAANCAEEAFRLAWSTGLLKHLLPGVAAYISDSGGKASVFWDFLAALDTYRKSNPDDKTLKSSNAASLIPLATVLAPLYLSKHAKSAKREHLARDLVAQNLVAQFSTKLFSQPEGLFRNIAFYLATLPEYRLGARIQRRDRRECLAIGRVFWEICATALGDSKALLAIKNSDEDEEEFPLGNDAQTFRQYPKTVVESLADDVCSGDDDGLGLELKRPKGDSPLVAFMKLFDETRLEPVFRRLGESGELETILPGIAVDFPLLSALDERREHKNLAKKSWRLVLPVAVVALPSFAAKIGANVHASPEELATLAGTVVNAIFTNLTRDKHTYSTIRKRASQVLQTLYLPEIPPLWMSDVEMYRAIREICVEALPGYIPPAEIPKTMSRRRRRGKENNLPQENLDVGKEDLPQE